MQPEEVELLGYFCRDCKELSESELIKNGPGSIKSWSDIPTETGVGPFLETAISDDEIRSYVTIFRRLYMENEPANFLKAAAVYSNALVDHPFGNWVAGAAESYKAKMEQPPERHPFIPKGQCGFTRKRLIDVFIYTKYAHQPTPQRQRQYQECLDVVQGKKSLLTWIFLSEIWKCGLSIKCVGKVITSWFNRYCQEHQIVADVLASISHENPGIGTKEKDEDRKARLFQEKAEELALELWNQNGCPPGGPSEFLSLAKQQLNDALGDGSTDGSIGQITKNLPVAERE